MPLELKNYQEHCLSVLREYLRDAAVEGAKTAFDKRPELRVKYHEVSSLPDLPYICLRVPTGGGKTILAAYSVGVVTREFLQAERCVVLWLAPTNAIVDQTIKALRNKSHPYRQALESDFGGDVEVFSIEEALRITRATLDGATTVIVSTLAALRVSNTEGRHVYETNGALQHHFSGLSELQLAKLEKSEDGVIAYSLANVLRLRRPLVVMDEAHNARTPLSFETLERLSPACILEFTATPAGDSNVLVSVSASELKAEQMVKLPIRLVSRPQWKEAVGAAVTKQRLLENIAKEEQKATGEYIRPIVLFQAQQRSEHENTITVDILRQCLLEDFNIPAEEIAEGTGQKWELPDNLSDVGPVRFILTVAKLREGWDCPFAYILCSVSNLSSRTAVEQILGRVLRLPGAVSKIHAELNHAYAFATSIEFADAASALTDALVDSGFERFEAQQVIEPDPTLPFGEVKGPLFENRLTEKLAEAPEIHSLPAEIRQRLSIAELPPAAPDVAPVVEITYTGPAITVEEAGAIKQACKSENDRKAVERLALRSRGHAVYPAALGETLSVPMLAIRFEEQLEIFEEQFRECDWDLGQCDPRLTEAEFSLDGPAGKMAQVDIDASGRLRVDFVRELHEQLSFNDLRGPQTASELAAWLDRNIDRNDRRYSTQAQIVLFLRRLVDDLLEARELPLEDIVSARFRLRDAVSARIHKHLQNAHKTAFKQLLLAENGSNLEVSPAICFDYPADQYPANSFYSGRFSFQKHFYERPGQLNSEEEKVAVFIDNLPQVKHWVRNLVRQPVCSFWMPTPTDKFYPDFVAELMDGRYLVVEYKGRDRKDNIDSTEKKTVGEVWEAKSKGRCIFRLVGIDDYASVLQAAIAL
jgi:type III restriction enzyme